jgi:hypothetical protein
MHQAQRPGGGWQPVALVGFMLFVEKNHKNHDYWAALGV